MPRGVTPIVSAVVVIFITALIVLGTNDLVLAGSECIEQPNREPAEGAHWYFHYDREKNRKCWHLEAAATKLREAARPAEQSDAASTSPFSSAFSSLLRGLTTATPTVAPQEPVVGEPRIIQSNPTKPLKLEDIAQQLTDIPEERAEPRYTPPLNAAHRRALFEDYLRWDEIQRNLGTVGAPARSP